MLTKEVKNVAKDLEKDVVVNLTSGTPLYAGSGQFILDYRENETSDIKSVRVERFDNISFKNTVKLVRIRGDAYIITDKNVVLSGAQISGAMYQPLAMGTKIYISDFTRSYDVNSHLEIHYYDSSILKLDFRDTKSYLLYDL